VKEEEEEEESFNKNLKKDQVKQNQKDKIKALNPKKKSILSNTSSKLCKSISTTTSNKALRK
jgi:hypothetical protein